MQVPSPLPVGAQQRDIHLQTHTCLTTTVKPLVQTEEATPWLLEPSLGALRGASYGTHTLYEGDLTQKDRKGLMVGHPVPGCDLVLPGPLIWNCSSEVGNSQQSTFRATVAGTGLWKRRKYSF